MYLYSIYLRFGIYPYGVWLKWRFRVFKNGTIVIIFDQLTHSYFTGNPLSIYLDFFFFFFCKSGHRQIYIDNHTHTDIRKVRSI